jgi:hypothetical protein
MIDNGHYPLALAAERGNECSAPVVLVIATDLKGIITFWNPGAERVLGWNEADAKGQSADACE